MKKLRAASRFVLFVISTLGLYSIWWFGAIFLGAKPSWRQWAFANWAKSFVRLSGVKIEVIGDPPKAPFFLVSNHLGYIDVAVLRYLVNGVFVAKAEIRDWFVAGKIVDNMGNVFIDRQNRRDIPRAGEVIVDKLEGGEGVIVFPEGTSTKGEDVLPFNSSFLQFAAKNDLAVYYASISYRTPENEEPASKMICWWDETTFMPHIFRSFSLKQYTATVTFGEEPIRNSDRKLLAKELHDHIAADFVPVL